MAVKPKNDIIHLEKNMNILELEEGIRNLIATQPAILSSENGKIIKSIKDIID